MSKLTFLLTSCHSSFSLMDKWYGEKFLSLQIFLPILSFSKLHRWRRNQTSAGFKWTIENVSGHYSCGKSKTWSKGLCKCLKTLFGCVSGTSRYWLHHWHSAEAIKKFIFFNEENEFFYFFLRSDLQYLLPFASQFTDWG